MIEIDLYEKAHRYAIKATGHAEYAAHGYDIVCSAVSTLIQTYAFYIEKEKSIYTKSLKILEIKLEPGDMNVEYLDLKDTFYTNFEMLLEGMKALENTYPGFIKLSESL